MSPSPAGTDAGARPPSIVGCLEACRRCRSLLDVLAAQEPRLARRAYEAIGPHLRHCLDHFSCLLRGAATGSVDYDARERDERLELDPAAFGTALDHVIDELERSGEHALGRPLAVRQAVAPGGLVRTVDTNLERELIFLSSHTIHHIAIMMLLAERAGVVVPQELGVAFSTASHGSQAVAAR